MKRKISNVLLVLTGVILAISLCQAFYNFHKYSQARAIYDNIEKIVLPSDESHEVNNKKTEEDKDNSINIDFKTLQSINVDVIAWISISVLDLEYPVVKGKDNEFYLHHAYDKTNSFAGCIFMDCNNTTDFTDKNTIIYGHNMLDRSMFGSLRDISMDKMPEVIIYMPEKILHYKIDREIYVDANDFGYYQPTYTRVPYNENERLLTLSTCGGDANKRHIFQCKRI